MFKSALSRVICAGVVGTFALWNSYSGTPGPWHAASELRSVPRTDGAAIPQAAIIKK